MAYCVFTSCLSLNGSGITPYTTLDSRSGVALTSNGQMAFFGSGDNSGPLGVVIQHICGHGICRVEFTGTRYGISGNDVSINIDGGNPAAVGGMLIKYQGGVAMGTGQPCGALDVYKPSSGATGTGDNLILRGGNNNNLFGTNQIRFGYSGGIGYSHAIKSRHNSGGNTDNSLDFFLWTTADCTETVGTKNVMTLNGTGNVGIGTCYPTMPLTFADALGGKILLNANSNNYSIGLAAGVVSADASMKFTAGCSTPGDFTFYRGSTLSMIITCAGNIGIGTSLPCNRLHVIGTDHYQLVVQDSNAVMKFGADDAIMMGIGMNANGFAEVHCDWFIGRHAPGSSGIKDAMYISRLGASSWGHFFVLNNCGNLGIGIENPGTYKLHVNGAFYAAGSSKEYKTSICEYNTDSCMFMRLKPVTYDYKEEWKHLGKELKSGTQIGLIAEETAEVFPELAVLKEEEDQKVVRNVDYEKLSIVLLSEVQKLRREVDDLKHKQ
jgi:hypothetical protein